MTNPGHIAPRASAAASRAWRGPAILSRGFRPFFLMAGSWALVGMALWLAIFNGAIEIPTAFSAVDWHAHEMIFGYGGAVIAGFLLTAIPNWTGRLPVAGVPLAALAGLWVAGRMAVFCSAAIGRLAATAIDVAFLAVFAAVIAREIVAGRNWRNLKTVGLVLALALANFAFHLEDARSGLASFSIRAALALIVMLLVLHVGFFFAAAGFFMVGAHAFTPTEVPYAAGVHVWAIGAVGVMTLAMMTRATLGHSGRALIASRGAQLAYLCVVAALVARIAIAFLPDFAWPLMDAAAATWILAFAAFLFVYAPMLIRRAGPI